MNIVPKAVPQSSQPSPQSDARSRAMSKFMGNQSPEQSPILNQNSVGVEELGAISQSKPEEEETEQQDSSQEGQSEPVMNEPAKAPEQDSMSKQYAILARQTKQLRQKQVDMEKSFKDREAALIKREQELTSQNDQYKTSYISRDRIKQNTLDVLAEAGVSYDEITQQILSQTPRDPRTEAHIARLEAQLAKLEEQSTNQQKQSIESQQAQYNAAVKQIKSDVSALVRVDPAFETVKATNSVQDVVELITKTYEQDGILLSVEDAAQQVEDYLIEEAMKLTSLNKIKQRLKIPTSPVQQAQVKQQTQNPKQPQMKTLTNNTSSSRQLSARERAVLAFSGKLSG